nr:Chain A, ILE-TYR-LYS-VAL-GLU-ILE [Homo sapiens]6C3F_B Chain B, ILE-TYR-LYS-VAL-GLU-ILE [Homo sapiens]
IYKVEI